MAEQPSDFTWPACVTNVRYSRGAGGWGFDIVPEALLAADLNGYIFTNSLAGLHMFAEAIEAFDLMVLAEREQEATGA